MSAIESRNGKWFANAWGRALIIFATCTLAIMINTLVGRTAITAAAWILVVQPLVFATVGKAQFREIWPVVGVGVALLVWRLGLNVAIFSLFER